ncbi:MAG: potassium/proton antiporter [Thomasclavelia ramosa]
MTLFLLLIAVVVIVCILATRLSSKFGVPTLLIFILLGMVFGSDGLFKISFDDFIISEQICTFALIYIMFYGGFCLNFNSAKPVLIRATIMSTLGVILTCGFVGLFCYWVLHTSLIEGMLIGAVMASTDAASVFSILRMKRLNLKAGIAPLLEMESGSNDPTAYMLTIIILTLLSSGKTNIYMLIFSQIIFGIISGVVIGLLAKNYLDKIQLNEVGLKSIFVAALALLAYALPVALNGNGFLSVYLFGIILGNSRLKKKVSLVHFFDSISHMMQILLFFLLGLLSFPSQIPDIIGSAILITLFLTFVARPLTVFICLTPFRVPFKQQLFISWCGLRGAASIVFAIMTVVSPAYTNNDIFHIVFFVALLSITFQGSLLPLVAKWLKVEDDQNDTMKTFNDYSDDSSFELIRVYLSDDHPWINQTLIDIVMPTNMLVATIIRDNQMILPKGTTRVLKGDLLIMCAPGYEGNDIYLDEEYIEEHHHWIDCTPAMINPRNKFLVVLIKRDNKMIIPDGKTRIKRDDMLVICKKEYLGFVDE